MKALLVEVDFTTGWRAGGVDPRDPNLQSYGWQSLPEAPGKDHEIRVVEDDRDLSDYEGVDGVEVIHGVGDINKAIEEHIPPNYTVGDRDDVREWARRNDVDLSDFPNQPHERRKALYEAGADTVRKEGPKIIGEDIRPNTGTSEGD